MRVILIIFFFSVQSLFCIAQENLKVFKRLTTQEGLSNSWVRCMFQDDEGYLWFGTADGLNRFDGYNFKIFRPLNSEMQGLGDIHINAITRKNDHELWVCSDLGVYSFNLEKEAFVGKALLSTLAVITIYQDSENNTWYGTGLGLYRTNALDSNMVFYEYNSLDASSISNNYINTIFEDSESNIWVGTLNGLNLYNRSDNSFTRFHNSEAAGSLSGNYIMSICEDQSKQLWIGTAQNGLNMISRSDSGEITFKKILDGYIISLLVDYQNYLWICKGSGEGLARLDINKLELDEDVKVDVFRYDPINNRSLSDNSVFCIYEDKTKDIWIGTFGGGVNYLSKREKKFNTVQISHSDRNSISNNLINALLEDDNFLWIGTEAGLDRYNKKNGRFRHFHYEPDNPTSLSANPIYALHKDSKGNLWIGTWSGGLNLFNERSETFKQFLPGAEPGAINNGNVFSILEDSRGNLWVGTIGGGLNRFNYDTKTFTHYIHDNVNSNSIHTNFVNHIYETKSGELYISTYSSLDIFNYEKDNFSHCYFNSEKDSPDGQIISIFEDSQQNIWIGTNTSLMLFDEISRKFIPILTQDDLPDNTIQGILEDSHGNLWISTNKGVSQFINAIHQPDQTSILNFSKIDGLSGDQFNKRAVFKNSSGVMYFGSSQGYTYFHPDSISINSDPPNIVFTDFQLLYSQPDKNKKYESTAENINEIEQLDLPYNNSSFIIQYSALNYLNPEKNQYQYKLEGYDKNWINAGNSRTTTYTNIPPGKYVFSVNGSNNDGIWSITPKQLTIIIHPPWWGTLIFKLIAVATLLLIGLLVHLARVSFIRKQNIYLEKTVKDRTNELSVTNSLLKENREEILTQNDELQHHRNHLEQLVDVRTSELVKAKVDAEESDRLKSSFLANISHEIRTPMNAIYGFSGILYDRELSEEERKEYLDIVYKNCESLIVLVDDIIDISLIEANHLIFENKDFEVDPLLLRLEKLFSLKNAKAIDFEFSNKENAAKLILHNDKVRFNQIVTNLLSNAFKYTESGQIKFGYIEFKTHVRFFVYDTGIGIPLSEINDIYNQFYKIENQPNKLYRGTGIGLAISKKMVELMGGEIWVESVVGKGSTFYFTLPKLIPDSTMHKPTRSLRKDKLRLKDVTILIAEESSSNFDLVEMMLNPFGAKIIRTPTGKETIKYIQLSSITKTVIVLMDIKLSFSKNYTLPQEIKQLNANIPIIAVKSTSQKINKEKLFKNGFDDYISKPIKLESLLAILTRFTS